MAEKIEKVTQFCVLPRKSIKLLGESVGIHYLSSEAAGVLSEDVSYRIRQIIESATQFSKHSKRDHVTGDDINKALFWSRVEPIYGYGSKNSNLFSSISTKDGNIFYHEDKEVNLRELTFSKGLASLSDVGDSNINIEILLLHKTSTTITDGNKSENNVSATPSFDSLGKVYKSYYEQVTKNILGSDHTVYKAILGDLRSNSRVQTLLPYFVNFISTGIKLVTQSFEKLSRLLAFTKTLVDNKNLYLDPWVVQLVRAMMFCAVEKPGFDSSLFDNWLLRKRAVQTLYHIDRKCNNSNNYLHHQLLRTFKDIFEDKERPLYSQYGAIVGICMLGVDAVDQVIMPSFKSYAEHVERLCENATSETITEISYVIHALQCSVLTILRHKLQQLAEISTKESQTDKSQISSNEAVLKDQTKWGMEICPCYQDAYQLFGESFVLQLGMVDDFKNIVQNKTVFPVQTQIRNTSYIRSLITNAVTPKPNFQDSATFVIPSKKRRLEATRLGQIENNPILQNQHDSEARFQNLVKKNHRQRPRSINPKNHTVEKRRHIKSLRRKTLFSLSHIL